MKVTKVLTDIDRPCAFVPTMGALHAGHQSLISRARELCDEVVVSVFVNPLQFEDQEEASKYPRTPERDIELAKESGVTHLWLPTFQEIYPEGFAKRSAGALGEIYEGASRSGHFDGVVTVVARLFQLVRPKIAIFGEKDFQQLTLIRKLVHELNSDIEIISVPTVREADGLAMSSRNVRLDETSRERSLVIYRALTAAAHSSDLDSARTSLQSIAGSQEGFSLDYAEIIDERDFSKAIDATLNKRAIIAGWLNGVRLIDNMEMKLGATR